VETSTCRWPQAVIDSVEAKSIAAKSAFMRASLMVHGPERRVRRQWALLGAAIRPYTNTVLTHRSIGRAAFREVARTHRLTAALLDAPAPDTRFATAPIP
jgi:hypothetical protein